MTVELRNVTVAFGERRVLDRVNLQVGTGEIVALLGASGSGKSTLLRAVAGLQAVSDGHVLIDNTDVSMVPTHQRNVGLIFQDQALFPHLDVAGNVAFGLRMQRTKRLSTVERAERVRALLALVGLAEFGSRRIDSLSGGEGQRVAVARALAPRPRVLLLDEPLSALDHDLRSRLAAELREILRFEGTTAIHVTHDTAEAAIIGDRTLHLAELTSRS
jgi:thiamine transport system ATP-binding protein